jgi:hypothetical protein
MMAVVSPEVVQLYIFVVVAVGKNNGVSSYFPRGIRRSDTLLQVVKINGV